MDKTIIVAKRDTPYFPDTLLIQRTIIVRENSPYTTDGIPASKFIADFKYLYIFIHKNPYIQQQIILSELLK